MSEGLAQGSYMAARVGFKPATLRMQGTKLTTEPPRLRKKSPALTFSTASDLIPCC